MISQIVRWLPMLLWMAAIFVISGQPSQELPNLGTWDLLGKKLAHFIAYAILALLALRGMGGGKRIALSGNQTLLPKRPFFFALLITFFYALSDEYHQTFVPGRHGMFFDVLIDSSGGIIALFWVWWRKRTRPKPLASPTFDQP